MGDRSVFDLAEYTCPNCGQQLGGMTVRLTRANVGMNLLDCFGCGCPLYGRVDRRGRLRISLAPPKALMAPDGKPHHFIWKWGETDSGTISEPVDSSTSRFTGRFPIFWTPNRADSRDVLLRPSSRAERPPVEEDGTVTPPPEVRQSIRCVCLSCKKFLTRLSWYSDTNGDSEPPHGVVVLDTHFKDRQLPLARLDQQLRGLRMAVAILACRRCKAETAYIFREPPSLRRVELDKLLSM